MYIVLAILGFGLLIFVHELGHFLVARACNVKVTEFALGFGPQLWHKEKGETTYSLRLLPIGGFCAMEGEEETSEDPRAFSNQTPIKRILILFAGAGMNFLLGLVLVWIIYFIDYLGQAPVWNIIRAGFLSCINFVVVVIQGLIQLFSGEAGISDLSGVVGVVDVINDVGQSSVSVKDGIENVVYLIAFIAVNLGVMNLLPFPGLDGGHIFTLIFTGIIEKIVGHKINPKIEQTIHYVGLILLMLLMVFVLFNDVSRIITK